MVAGIIIAISLILMIVTIACIGCCLHRKKVITSTVKSNQNTETVRRTNVKENNFRSFYSEPISSPKRNIKSNKSIDACIENAEENKDPSPKNCQTNLVNSLLQSYFEEHIKTNLKGYPEDLKERPFETSRNSNANPSLITSRVSQHSLQIDNDEMWYDMQFTPAPLNTLSNKYILNRIDFGRPKSVFESRNLEKYDAKNCECRIPITCRSPFVDLKRFKNENLELHQNKSTVGIAESSLQNAILWNYSSQLTLSSNSCCSSNFIPRKIKAYSWSSNDSSTFKNASSCSQISMSSSSNLSSPSVILTPSLSPVNLSSFSPKNARSKSLSAADCLLWKELPFWNKRCRCSSSSDIMSKMRDAEAFPINEKQIGLLPLYTIDNICGRLPSLHTRYQTYLQTAYHEPVENCTCGGKRGVHKLFN